MDFRELTDADYRQAIGETKGGLVLFHKKLCPHCRNIRKVIEKFAAKAGPLAVMAIDIEDQSGAAADLEVDRAPTLLIIKQGRETFRKMGLFNPRELAGFYNRH